MSSSMGPQTIPTTTIITAPQPMSDMLSVIVTMHPRATAAIADMWALADLPSYNCARTENGQRVVVLETMKTLDQARDLLVPYLSAFRSGGEHANEPLFPFTEGAVQAILTTPARRLFSPGCAVP
jgi:hypothetical protein